MNEVKLYGYATSPYVRKTACFLYFKGLEFTHVPVNPLAPEETLAHTNGTQVPVLEIDGEFRRESSDHAVWLDEIIADKPLIPPQHRDLVLELDQWVSNTFLTSIFRYAIDGEMNLRFRQSSWRLAALVSAQTPLSDLDRHLWPEKLKTIPFIQNMAKHLDMTESHQAMQARVFQELIAHLRDGPYFGGLDQPTMIDFAIFPQLVFGYLFGLEETLSAAGHPLVKQWLKNTAEHLPDNPTLAADAFQVQSLADALN